MVKLFGGSGRNGLSVTEARAFALTIVWACIDIKSDVYASFPYKLYRKTNEGRGREVARDHHLYPIVSTRPNGHMNVFDFQKAKATQILKNGNCYVIPRRNGFYEIESLFLVPDPNQVEVIPTDNDEGVFYRYKGQIYSPDEIVHYKWFTLDGRIGVDPITYHKDTLELGLSALFFGSDVLKNGSIQPAVLETEQSMNAPDAHALGDSFHEAYGGLGDKSKSIPVMHSGLKYKPITYDPDKAQVLKTKLHIIEEVCRIFNMPPSIVHHHIQSNYNSSEHQDLTFLKYSMNPFVTRMEAEDRIKLLSVEEAVSGDVYFKHTVDALLRPDFEKRTEGLSKLVNSSIYDRNEARAKMDADYREDLDEMLAPVNTMPASLMVKYYEAKIEALQSKAKEETDGTE